MRRDAPASPVGRAVGRAGGWLLAALATVSVGAIGALGACGGEKFTAAGSGSDDGGVGDDGGSGADASSDGGSTIDGGGVTEGGVVDASGPSFCAANPGHAFCDDFERDSNDVKGPWDGVLSSGAATIQIDSASSKSPPQSLSARTKPGAQDNTVAALQKSAGKFRVYHASFDIQVDSYADPNATQAAIALSVDLGQNIGLSMSLLGPNAAVILESTGTGVKPHSLSKGIPTGRFTNVKIDVTTPTVSNTQGNLHVTFDGVVVLDDHLNIPLTATLTDAKVTIGVIPFGGDAGAPWAYRFDNVLLDRGP